MDSACAQRKNHKKLGAGLVPPGAGAVEMLSPLETGTARGRLRDVGGTGKPEPDAGSRHWRAARSAGKARRLADLMRRGQARSPASHTWRGPCPIPPVTGALARTDTPASTPAPATGTPGPRTVRTGPARRARRRRPQRRTRGSAGISGHPPGPSLSRPEFLRRHVSHVSFQP